MLLFIAYFIGSVFGFYQSDKSAEIQPASIVHRQVPRRVVQLSHGRVGAHLQDPLSDDHVGRDDGRQAAAAAWRRSVRPHREHVPHSARVRTLGHVRSVLRPRLAQAQARLLPALLPALLLVQAGALGRPHGEREVALSDGGRVPVHRVRGHAARRVQVRRRLSGGVRGRRQDGERRARELAEDHARPDAQPERQHKREQQKRSAAAAAAYARRHSGGRERRRRRRGR